MGRIIGIDLGTTNSVAAVLEAGKPEVIPSREGNHLIPSVVAIKPKSNDQLIGQSARRQAVGNPENTIFSVKRFIGRKYNDQLVSDAAKLMPNTITAASNGDVRIRLNDRDYSAPEISAMLLQKIKADVEDCLGETVDQAVITVPAYFNDIQRRETMVAGQIAGLDVLRIINEPTAASLYYGFDGKNDGTIAVYDLGGGTFDISILEIRDGVFKVLSTHGDTFLGGDNFDERIIDWMADEFEQEHGIDLRCGVKEDDRRRLQRMKEAAEEAKIELSTVPTTEISLPFIIDGESGPQNLNISLSRAKLEGMVNDLVEKTIAPCQDALKDAGLEAEDIDTVILAGGMTRMPFVQQVVKDIFGKDPSKRVNPDEVVALGAAIEAGILDGDIQDIVLQDVVPLRLGIRLYGGLVSTLIKRNTPIPVRVTRDGYSTVVDNQSEVKIDIVQGEREMADENTSLGEFVLSDIPPAPSGEPKLEVSFDLDVNSILKVTAKDLATGNEKVIIVNARLGLTEEEVERLIAEAQENAEQDAARKNLVEACNEAESQINRAERLLRLYPGQLSSKKHDVEHQIKEVQKELERERDLDMEKATENIKQATKHLEELLSF